MKNFLFSSGRAVSSGRSRRAPLPRLKHAGGGTRGAWNAAESSRLTASWFTSGTPINQEIEADLTALRTRSRDLAKNSDYIRRFFQLVKSNVVGPTGFRFASGVLRSTGKPDDPARFAISTGWKEFTKKGVPCAQGRLSLWDMQNLAVESLFRDGEVILLQYTGPSENKFGVSFKFIDPTALDVNHRGEHGGNPVKMGIETDARGRVVAYHFKSTDTTHASYYQHSGKGAIRVEARHVIHRFLVEYVDQIRGFPYMAASMFRLKRLDGYEGAELTSAEMAAKTMGFIERGEDGGSLEGAAAVLDSPDDDEHPEEPSIEAEAGAFHYIENGAKIHDWGGNHTPTAYGAFTKGVLRGIASGLGVSYNSLANDLEGVNYSSIRQAVLEDRDFWRAIQNWMIENILDEIYARWLEASLLRAALVMPNGSPLKAASIDRYQAHTFTGRRWQWVDPLKDISAAEKAISLRIRSRSSVIRELTNEDPTDVWREIQEEDELLEEMGIAPAVPTKETPTNDNPNEAGDGDDEDDREG